MLQKLIIVGNLGNDPELRYTPSGQAVTNLSVATNRRWTDNNGQRQEETIWFRVSTWGRLAETCNQYLSKGQQVYCEGRLSPDRETGEPRIWTDQNGKPWASYDMTAFDVRFLGGRGDSAPGSYNDQSGEMGQDTGIAEDEIPF